jgi:hypothetical protein
MLEILGGCGGEKKKIFVEKARKADNIKRFLFTFELEDFVEALES